MKNTSKKFPSVLLSTLIGLGVASFALSSSAVTLKATPPESGELPQQVNQLQTVLMEAHEKIATLATDQQKNAGTISALQISLNTAQQEISGLKSRHAQLAGTNPGIHRSANGHGR